MRRVPVAGGLIALVDPEDYDRVMRHRWHLSGMSPRMRYAETEIDGRKVVMHRLILGTPPDRVVRHLNGVRLDNRRENLCTLSPGERCHSAKRRPGTSSRFKGVSWHVRINRWVANIAVDGRQHYLGTFTDEREAALAYNRAAALYYGEHAFVNDLAA